MTLRGKRVLIAKPGLDGHDVGAKVISLALIDAGAEVIYTGLRKSPDQIVHAAIEEDVDAVGLSILSGSHLELVEAVVQGLREAQAVAVKVFVGGTIPRVDRAPLAAAGASGVFTADMPIDDVVAAIDRSLGDDRE